MTLAPDELVPVYSLVLFHFVNPHRQAVRRLAGIECHQSYSKRLKRSSSSVGISVVYTLKMGKKKVNLPQRNSEVLTSLDNSIWQGLPEDLIDRVLASLPLITLFRIRCVCRKWNSMINSPVFLELCSQVRSRESYFLLFPTLGEETVCSAFDTSIRRWQKMPSLGFLPPHVKYVDSAASGLLLFSVGSQTQSLSLYVCNPMTKRWKQLPPVMQKRTPIVRHLVVDRKLRRYKIILAGNIDLTYPESQRNPCTSTAVYDSTCERWFKCGKLPFDVDLNWSSVYSDGILFCVANLVASSTLVLATFDVQRGTWSEGFYEFPDVVSLAQVVEFQGGIYAVCEVYRLDDLKSIYILKLNLETRLWTQISVLPRVFLRDFRVVCEEESFNSIVLEGKIFLTSFRGMQVLVFDIPLRSWSWLTPCDHFTSFDHRAAGFAFEPCLHISP
ncbi:hypothetical protein R1sor_008272 [Riccia sorocarpa]|uniref:F-box domain-containing protein n=1 Tax=Riccia sorocarpa TaxID=122646 RepID=A0ABD3HUJ9_9MARC